VAVPFVPRGCCQMSTAVARRGRHIGRSLRWLPRGNVERAYRWKRVEQKIWRWRRKRFREQESCAHQSLLQCGRSFAEDHGRGEMPNDMVRVEDRDQAVKRPGGYFCGDLYLPNTGVRPGRRRRRRRSKPPKTMLIASHNLNSQPKQLLLLPRL
jgi:hypothetical protein